MDSAELYKPVLAVDLYWVLVVRERQRGRERRRQLLIIRTYINCASVSYEVVAHYIYACQPTLSLYLFNNVTQSMDVINGLAQGRSRCHISIVLDISLLEYFYDFSFGLFYDLIWDFANKHSLYNCRLINN